MESGQPRREVFSFTLGTRTEQNPFSGVLAAISYALRNLPDSNRQKHRYLHTQQGGCGSIE